MRAIYPPPLTTKDKIQIVATAGPVDKQAFLNGISLIKKHFNSNWDLSIFTKTGFLAGDDKSRASSLQKALNSNEIKAILAARGGWGTTRIIDEIDFDLFVKKPKWIVGSSDLTALLIKLWSDYGIVSIHGPMVEKFEATANPDIDNIVKLLHKNSCSLPQKLIPLINGKAQGNLIGGNLTMLAHICGAVKKDFARDSLLFLEDVGEYPYRIDRCLVQLKRAGVFNGIKGLILGNFTNCNAAKDKVTVSQILAHHLKPIGVPIATGFPAAHGGRNFPFIHGAMVELIVRNDNVKMTYLPIIRNNFSTDFA